MKKYIKGLVVFNILFTVMTFIIQQKSNNQSTWIKLTDQYSEVIDLDDITIENQSIFYETLIQLAHKYHVNIIKTEYGQNTVRHAVYLTYPLSKYYRTNNQLKINVENTDTPILLSTDKDSQSDGIILDLFADNNIELMTLKRYLQDHHLTGKLYFTFSENNINEFNQEIKMQLYDIDITLENNDYQKSQSFIYDGLIIIINIIFAVSLFYYGSYHLKEIGIYKLNGYDDYRIYMKLFKSVLFLSFIASFLMIILTIISVKNIHVLFILNLLKRVIIINVIILCISLILFYVIKNYSVLNMIKGNNYAKALQRVNSIIRFITVTLCFCCFAVIFCNINKYKHYQDTMKYWIEYQDLVQIKGIESDNIESLIHFPNEEKISDYKEFYKNIAADGHYWLKFTKLGLENIVFHGKNLQDLQDNEYFKTEDFDLNVDFNFGTINTNYLNELNLIDLDGNPIRIDEKETNQIMIMPKSKLGTQNYEYILKVFLADNISEEEYPLNIQYYIYDDSQQPQFFSFTIRDKDDEYYHLNSPFFRIITPNNILNYDIIDLFSSGMEGSIKFLTKEKDITALEKEINKKLNDLTVTIRLEPLSEPFEEQIQMVKTELTISLFIMVILTTTYLFILFQTTKLYVIYHQKEIAIKKLMGYTIYQSMQHYIKTMLYTDCVAIVFYLIAIQNHIKETSMSFFHFIKVGNSVYFGFIPLMIIDILIVFISIKVTDKRKIYRILKGETYGNY